jgi:hypothetical protein
VLSEVESKRGKWAEQWSKCVAGQADEDMYGVSDEEGEDADEVSHEDAPGRRRSSASAEGGARRAGAWPERRTGLV